MKIRQKAKYVGVAMFIFLLAFSQMSFGMAINQSIGPRPPYAICVGTSDVRSDGDIEPWYGELQDEQTKSKSSHWYAGSLSKPHLPFWVAGRLQVTINTPNGYPGVDEFYYILLSCFDNVGSYNQIGFAAINGHWGLTWSWTEHDFWGNLIFHFDADAKTLKKGTTYVFEMSFVPGPGGEMDYNLYQGSSLIWTKTVTNGGSYFIITDYVLVGFRIYGDTTNYEEIYETDADTPDFHFKFRYTKYYDNYVWTYFDDWNEFYRSAPSGVDVTISAGYHYVYVENPDGP
jgi:hypothetical protein